MRNIYQYLKKKGEAVNMNRINTTWRSRKKHSIAIVRKLHHEADWLKDNAIMVSRQHSQRDDI
jgi:hypothetical protein